MQNKGIFRTCRVSTVSWYQPFCKHNSCRTHSGVCPQVALGPGSVSPAGAGLLGHQGRGLHLSHRLSCLCCWPDADHRTGLGSWSSGEDAQWHWVASSSLTLALNLACVSGSIDFRGHDPDSLSDCHSYMWNQEQRDLFKNPRIWDVSRLGREQAMMCLYKKAHRERKTSTCGRQEGLRALSCILKLGWGWVCRT